jgi:hypothetical protein
MMYRWVSTSSRYRQLARDVLRRAQNLGRLSSSLTLEQFRQAVRPFYPFKRYAGWPLAAWKAEVELAIAEHEAEQERQRWLERQSEEADNYPPLVLRNGRLVEE